MISASSFASSKLNKAEIGDLYLLKTLLAIHQMLRESKLHLFICYLAASQPTSGHYQRDGLTHPRLIAVIQAST